MSIDLIEAYRKEFAKLKRLADDAVAQLSRPHMLFERPASQSNSIAIVMKHVGGNLLSRWTDFLTTDGEKPGRNRDSEFVVEPGEGEKEILAIWESGWGILFGSLSSLTTADLDKPVRIRGEEMPAAQAICRSLAHTAYHTGQIVYLCRMFVKEGWSWLTIPPGESAAYNRKLGMVSEEK